MRRCGMAIKVRLNTVHEGNAQILTLIAQALGRTRSMRAIMQAQAL